MLLPASSEELSGCPERDPTGSTPLAAPVSLEVTVLSWTAWCCGFATAQTPARSELTHGKRHLLKTDLLKMNFTAAS